MYEDFHGYGLQDGEYLMALEELLYDSILQHAISYDIILHYVCVRVYVQLYICRDIDIMYVCMCVHNIYIYIYIYSVNIYIYIYTHIHTQMLTHVYAHAGVRPGRPHRRLPEQRRLQQRREGLVYYIYIYICVYKLIYICTHMYIYIYIYTHTQYEYSLKDVGSYQSTLQRIMLHYNNMNNI